VTGASGFTGRALVRALCARGSVVLALDLRRHGALDARAVFTPLDVAAPGARGLMAAAFAAHRVGCVIHSAALVPFNLPRAPRRGELDAVNVGGTRAVIDAARDAGVRGLVYVSSTGAVFRGRDIAGADEAGAPVPPRGGYNDEYSQSKGLAEAAVLAANGSRGRARVALATAAIRPNGIWGPGEVHHFGKVEVVAKLGLSGVSLCPAALTDFTHVDNLVAALLLAADALAPPPPPSSSGGAAASAAPCDGAVDARIAGRAYFVTDGHPQSTMAFFSRVTAPLGFAPPRLVAPTCLARGLAAALQAGAAAAALLGAHPEPFLTLSDVRKLSAHNYYDSSAAARELRYAPVVEEAAAIAAMTAHMRARGFDGALLLPGRAVRAGVLGAAAVLAWAARWHSSGPLRAWCRVALSLLAASRVVQAVAVFRLAWARNWNAGGNAAAALLFGVPVTRAVLSKGLVSARAAAGAPEAIALALTAVALCACNRVVTRHCGGA
jgi:nucleoside-diphosphate-sugar epimerase